MREVPGVPEADEVALCSARGRRGRLVQCQGLVRKLYAVPEADEVASCSARGSEREFCAVHDRRGCMRISRLMTRKEPGVLLYFCAVTECMIAW